MNRQSCRSDFISDNSSSDEESQPGFGASLRERLARKRQFNKSFSSSAENLKDNTDQCKVSRMVGTSLNKNKKDESFKKSEDVDSTSALGDSQVSTLDDKIDIVHQTAIDKSRCETVLAGAVVNHLSHDGSLESVPVKTSDKDVGKGKKKRTREEIEDNRRKAQEKKVERERQKLVKEAEKQMRKANRESKKQFSLGSCLQYLKVLVDTHILNSCGLGVAIFKACEELGVKCETKELLLPNTVVWKRKISESTISDDVQVQTVYKELDEKEMLAVLPVMDFVNMVYTFKQQQKGVCVTELTFRDYVNQLKTCQDKNVTVIVLGIEQYFKDLQSQKRHKFKTAVQSADAKHVAKSYKSGTSQVTVSRVDIEEAVTDTLLQTGCSTYMLESPDDVADFVRRFSKAVAERPAKKDRFDPIFSFHEEGVGGVKVDKNGVGLLKVWKQQLLQFKNVSADVAQAIIAEYPSPLSLKMAYNKCNTEKEGERLLENIVVRRGAGVLETARRVGKELSRRIYIFFTMQDPGYVIK